jgi:predicted RNA-binding protein with PIN domain
VASPTLYLFDGYNLLHAGGGRSRQELVDRLAGFVALRGARGVVVFDGVGDDGSYGPLEVRFARSADDLLERLAAENRHRERICLVSSDDAIRRTAGQEVGKRTSKDFVMELDRNPTAPASEPPTSRIEDALDDTTRDRLERWRRRRT